MARADQTLDRAADPHKAGTPLDPPLDRAVQAAKAVAHPARLRLLAMLRHGPLCVCQMTAVLKVATSTVSGHLLELKRAGLVAEEKRGKWVEYRLRTDGPFARLLDEALTLVESDPVTAADRHAVRGVTAVPVEVFCRTGLDVDKAQKVRRSDRRGAGAVTDGPQKVHGKGHPK